MTLVESIVNYFTTGASAEATALRAMLPIMAADILWSNPTPPYCLVEDKVSDVEYEPIGKARRIDKVVITFSVYAATRASASAIMSAIEDTYLRNHLSEAMAKPTLMDRATKREKDYFVGTLNFNFYVEKNPQ
jgi:hypothetical protein